MEPLCEQFPVTILKDGVESRLKFRDANVFFQVVALRALGLTSNQVAKRIGVSNNKSGKVCEYCCRAAKTHPDFRRALLAQLDAKWPNKLWPLQVENLLLRFWLEKILRQLGQVRSDLALNLHERIRSDPKLDKRRIEEEVKDVFLLNDLGESWQLLHSPNFKPKGANAEIDALIQLVLREATTRQT